LTKNNLASLPGALFSSLKLLKIVDVSENILETLPETIGECSYLEILRLSDNNLSDLPMELAQCGNLVVLNISRNMMDQLPLVVTQCSSIEQLFMNDMFLTELPEDIGLDICFFNLVVVCVHLFSRSDIIASHQRNICFAPHSPMAQCEAYFLINMHVKNDIMR
jgi:Leucine-rich repeat (LRR) protein